MQQYKTQLKKPNRKIWLFLFLIFVVVTLSYFVLAYYADVEPLEIKNLTECSNLTLEKTAYCMRDYVKTFYSYTVRSDELRTLEDIQENGGDCHDYNSLYERVAEDLGFEGYSFRIETEDLAHRFAVIVDNTGYCRLDQISDPDCFMFAQRRGNES